MAMAVPLRLEGILRLDEVVFCLEVAAVLIEQLHEYIAMRKQMAISWKHLGQTWANMETRGLCFKVYV